MDARQRRRHIERQEPPFVRLLTALANDPPLVARAGAALAALTATGGAAGAALLLLARIFGSSAAGGTIIGVGLLLGAGLAALAIGLRRGRAATVRGQRRTSIGMAALALATVAVTPRILPLPLLAALILGTVVATLAMMLGLWAGSQTAQTIHRAMHARRAAWHAQLRAARLTRRMLGYQAYRQLRREGALPVASTIYPGRTYLVPIRTTPSGARILVLQGERPIGGLCLRPREPLPDPEEALTHILAIRTDERAWLAHANFFPQDRALTPQALGLTPGRPGNYDR